ncbi:MAG: right-handed parallel beta-helix repeat-containing protein [Cryomorphaceae bacterium]|nr:right-handed parallel beta-helix repeat-containing protein [Cryomorphaceae bacterium]
MMKNYKNTEKRFSPNRWLSFAIALMVGLFSQSSYAQIVLSTATGTNYTGANGVGGDAAVTFVIENTNSDSYLLNDIDVYWITGNDNANVELWVSSTDLSGLPSISTPSWTQITTAGPISVPSDGYYPTFNNIGYTVPGNTTLRFAVRSSNGIRYSGAAGPPAPSTFTQSGISLHSGDYQIGGQDIGYGGSFTNPSNNPRWFTGIVQLFPTTGTDLAITEFIEPVASCPGSSNVSVAIRNVSGDDITSATVGWSLNGVAQGSTNFSGLLETGDTAHVNLGGFTSVSSVTYDIETYLTSVGPGNDVNSSNDTLVFNDYQSALDGNFTIDPNIPSSVTNFQTFSDAINALNTFGVCGPVVFTASADTFNEQIILGDVVGSSATNSITFIGSGAGNTVLTFEQNVSDDRFTWRFEGASHVTVDSMSIIAADGGTYGWALHITSGASDLTIKNCSIETNGTSTLYNGIVLSNTNTGYTTQSAGHSNIFIENNVIIGGYTNIRLNGSSTDKLSNVVITNNTLLETNYSGIYLLQVENVEINDNYFESMTGNTTGAGIWFSSVDNFQILRNDIYDQGQYGIYFTASNGTSANPSLIANNAISGVGNTGNFGAAIRVVGNSNFVDIIHNSCLLTSGTGRVFQITVTTPDDIRVLNNSFVHTESDGYAMYVSNNSVISEINNNNYFSTGSNFVYYDSDQANLAALQAVNSPVGNDANSVSADPLYIAVDNLMPLNGALDGAGVTFPGVTTDKTGATRATPPDIGAYEFTPVNNDVALIEANILGGECLSSNDSIEVLIVNTVGSTINFANDTVIATWEVTGPNNSNGTVVFGSGTLAEGDTAIGYGVGVDLLIPGIYTYDVYISINAVNESGANDTLTGQMFERRDVFEVSPTSVTVTNNMDSVEISASSPFLPGGDVFITEICHFKTGNGAPAAGWPSYLAADDYIEVTGVPNSDISGFTIEMWSATGLTNASVLSPGTVLSPQGTAVIATGQLGSSVPSPANFYYHSGYTGTMGSTTAQGYVIKDPNGVIVDAVIYGNISFPAASGVTAADWSGTTPALSSSGNRLEGAYTKDATNWTNSGTGGNNNGQDPNVVNQNVNVPSPAPLTGFEWSHQGTLVDTVVTIKVGPWTVPGTYYYVASLQSPCGVLTDSVEIIVDFPFCFGADSIMVSDGCEEVDVTWIEDTQSVSSDIEYGPAGFTPGTGTVVSGVSSPATITGLNPATDYELYMIDSCSGAGIGMSDAVPFTTDVAPVAGPIDFVNAGSGLFEFTTDSTSFGDLTWDFGDGNSATGDSVSNQYAVGGTYTVMLIASNSCGADTTTIQVTFTSIEKYGVQAISMYPNPTTGVFTLNQLPTDGGEVTLILNDIQGRTVMTKGYDEGLETIEVSIENLPAGTYYLNISNKKGNVVRPVILVK